LCGFVSIAWVDTIITCISRDPWEYYEENPDHIATAHAVEVARWMAGSSTPSQRMSLKRLVFSRGHGPSKNQQLQQMQPIAIKIYL